MADMPSGWVRNEDVVMQQPYIYWRREEFLVARRYWLSPDGNWVLCGWTWTNTDVGEESEDYPDPVTCAVACELFNGGCDAQEHSL